MKTSHSIQKKTELRERFLRYATENAQSGRIPTVAECRRALNVTNYMLLNCMNELEREGIIYKKSRKEGTFLSPRKTKSVVGLLVEQGRENEYVNSPAWLSGFCSAFSHQDDFMLRLVSRPANRDLSSLIRQLGLEVLVVTTGGSYSLQQPEKEADKIVYALTGMTENCRIQLPEKNTISVDTEFWIREYVRSGIRRGKKNFAIISQQDAIAQVMIDEITRQNLPWNPECHLSDMKKLDKKLPEIVKKYNIDAVRCSGKFLPMFAAAAQKIPGFHPMLPFFSTANVCSQIQNDYPWLDCCFPFEFLDDFYTRLGEISARSAFKAAAAGTAVESVKVKINYSKQYKAALNNNVSKQGKSLGSAIFP